jgi:pimeloyl-ACP methyl ester carboxylesterase
VKIHRLALAALLVTTLGSCGTEGPPAAPPTTAAPLPNMAPDPDDRCAIAVPGEKVVLAAEDGLPLAAARYGTGHHSVVLAHQRGSDMCGWAPYVADLVGTGVQVLAVDLRCHGYSECPTDDLGDLDRDYAADVGAAVAEQRRTGANRVIVMGASMGAAAVFVAAGRYPDEVDGVIALSIFSASASVSASGVTSASDAATHVTAPTLICLSTSDASSIQTGAADTLIAAGAAKADGSVVVRPGVTHGWDMLRDPVVREAVFSFLRAHA